MKSFGPTSLADCEIIVKTFEKAAIFSTDPKSVYAMTTPILSKMRSDAQNTDKQFQKQFDYTDKMTSRRESQNASMGKPSGTSLAERRRMPTMSDEDTARFQQEAEENNKSAAAPPLEEDQSEFEELVDDLYGAGKSYDKKNFGQQYMTKCIPCEEKIRSSIEFNKKFWSMGEGGAPDQWLNLQEAALMGALEKLKNMLDMFRNQGRNLLGDICSFLDMFDNIRCPSDVLMIIKGLSTLLVKISIDLLGDFSFLMDLVAALITPLISSIVQLLKNFVNSIIEPLWCIIDALHRQMRTAAIGWTAASQEFIQEVGEGGLGTQTTIADRDYSKSSAYFPEVEESNFPTWMEPGSGSPGVIPKQNESRRQPDLWGYDLEAQVPEMESDITYRHFIELDRRKSEMEDIAKKSKTEARLQTDPEYRKVKKEWDAAGYRQGMKKVEDELKSWQSTTDSIRSTIETVMNSLMEMALWIENFLKDWLKEFGNLIGDSMNTEMGFLKKQGKKLTTIQAIMLFKSFLGILGKGHACENNEELLEQILTDAYGYDKNVLVKKEDGTITLEPAIRGVLEQSLGTDREESWKELNIVPTGDPIFDNAISGIEQIRTAPTETVFSCNQKGSSNANAGQIKQWMQELDSV